MAIFSLLRVLTLMFSLFSKSPTLDKNNIDCQFEALAVLYNGLLNCTFNTVIYMLIILCR